MRSLSLVSLLAAAMLLPGPLQAEAKTRYKTPHKSLAALIDRTPTPSITIAPDNAWIVVLTRPSLSPLSELAAPELRLAGTRINPRTNGRSRQRFYTELAWQRVDGKGRTVIKGVPAGARIRNVGWSPDSKRIAFTVTRGKGIALWVADVGVASATRLTEPMLNGTTGAPCDWMSDSKTLLCKTILANRGAPPVKRVTPIGPVVQESAGRKSPARTYQDLLRNRYDERLFDYYFKAQLALVTTTKNVTRLPIKGVVAWAEPSPDGKLILVNRIVRPYSYLVPKGRFPRRVEVFRRNGRLLRRIAAIPLADQIPIGFGSVRTGPRSFGWRADADATLYWVEARDRGDVRRKAKIRDRIFTFKAPFRGRPARLMDLELRFSNISWGSGKLALVREYWWKTRKVRTWMIAPGKRAQAPKLLFDRSWEDRYNDPGQPALTPTGRGTRVLARPAGGNSLFLTGTGASPQGNRPFVNMIDLDTKKTTRLWRSRAPHYESPIRILDTKGSRVITRRESRTQPPNYFVRTLDTKDKIRPLTRFPHPHPELRGIKKELIRYKRADGVMLTANLYLPKNYRKGTRLPMVMWAYPREFKSARAAGQVTDSPHRFVRVGWWSPVLWLLRGYAVLDGPTMPIIGEGKREPNDTYVKQLVASAKAAVDEVVRRKVADRNRIAIGGHSYGAFMTANLLARSDLFRAGIARSGAYNRTLTPFGFQSEERTLWEAPEIYFRMSPFMHAGKIDEPLLLIHGAADNNSGTFPLQSRRLYAAVQGLGGTARLVMLPHESHGYRARESVMHMLWETDRWLEKHVKRAGKRKPKPKAVRPPKPKRPGR